MIRNLRRKLFYSMLDKYKQKKLNQANTDIDTCLSVSRSMIAGEKYGFLITHGRDGWCSTRIVQPIVDGEFMIWIGTNPKLRKIAEVDANSKVTFAFQNTKQDANLIIYGQATIVDDLPLKKKYWKKEWVLFFPDGPESEDYVLIRIDASRIELMNFAKSVVQEPFGLKPAVIEKKDGAWSMVDHEAVANA